MKNSAKKKLKKNVFFLQFLSLNRFPSRHSQQFAIRNHLDEIKRRWNYKATKQEASPFP